MLARLLVLRSSPRIFEEKGDCSQSSSLTKQYSLEILDRQEGKGVIFYFFNFTHTTIDSTSLVARKKLSKGERHILQVLPLF